MNLAALLPTRATGHPAKPAVVVSYPRGATDRVITYQELHDAIVRFASGLVHAGLRAGKGVLMLQPMSPELYVLLVGAWCAGAVVLLLDPGRGPGQAAAWVRRWTPRRLAGPALVHWASWLIPGLRHRWLLRVRTPGWAPGMVALTHWLGYGSAPVLEGPADLAGDTAALVTLTSGSTRPKAVVRSHGFLRQQHRVLARLMEHDRDPFEAVPLPVFLLSSLASGTTSVVPPGHVGGPSRIHAAAVARQWFRWRPLQTGASPAFLERLLADRRAATELARLRTVFVEGGPVRTSLLRALQCAACDAHGGGVRLDGG